MKSPGYVRLLVLLLVVGAALRVIGISTSLWTDEVDSLLHCVRLPVREIVTTYPSENQHPLHSLLAHASIAAFGEHEWSLRLPALVFGVLCIGAVARLGRQVLGETTGLLAALLLAVSFHAVWFSQNARGYTGLLFFTTLATSEMLELFVKPHKRGVVRYALWMALALYTHLTAAFVLAGHALVWLGLRFWKPVPRTTPLIDCEPLEPPRATARALVAMLAGAALAVLLYAPMLDDLVKAFTSRAAQSSVEVVKVEPWTHPTWALEQVVQSFGGGVASAIGLAFVAWLFVAGTISLWRNGRRTFVAVYAVSLPVALAFLLALDRHLYPRFFFYAASFVAVAIVRGALMSGGWISCKMPGCKEQRTLLWGIAVTLLVSAGSALSLQKVYDHPKQDFVGARDFVESQAGPYDVKVAVGPAKLALPGYYAPAWKTADSAEELARLRASAPAAWVAWTQPEQLRSARPDVLAMLEREFDVVARFPGSLAGGEVVVARSRR